MMPYILRQFLLTSLLVSVASVQNLNAQQENPANRLHEYMVSVRDRDTQQVLPDVIQDREHVDAMLHALSSYYSDTLPVIRRKAFYLTSKICAFHPGFTSRAIEQLTGGIKDPDSGIVGSVMDYLKSCPREHYSERAEDTLIHLLHRGTSHYKKLIKLIGYLDVKSEIPYLKQKLRTRDYSSSSERWALLLALSRMGEPQAIEFCLRIAQKMPVGDDFVYDIAPGFIYTRQKQLVDYLVSQLYADSKNCSSPNPESTQNIHCGYRLMEYLAPVVIDFPLGVDAAGEIRSDNYREALQITRDWFKEHRDDYRLDRDIY